MKKRKVVRRKEKEIIEELIFIAKIASKPIISIVSDGDTSDMMQIFPSVGLRKKKPKEEIITPRQRIQQLIENENVIDEMYLLAKRKDGTISFGHFKKLWKQTFSA